MPRQPIAILVATAISLGVLAPSAAGAPPKLRVQADGVRAGSGTVVGERTLLRPPKRVKRVRGGRDTSSSRLQTAPDDAGNTEQVDLPEELPPADPPDAEPEDDLEIFRLSEIMPGTAGQTNTLAQPMAANDRNAVLAVGNHFMAISEDNGHTPFTARTQTVLAWDDAPQTAAGGEAPGDVFCCDQTVVAIDQGPSSMFVWTHMTSDTSANDGDGERVNTIRLTVFRNRAHLLENVADVLTPEVCSFAFDSRDLGLGPDRFLDFPQVATTDEHVYVSAVSFGISGGGDIQNLTGEGFVWRLPIDDLADPDCGIGPTPFDVWIPDGSAQAIRLVNGAGSTMFMARHRQTTFLQDGLRIWSVADSTNRMVTTDRDIVDFADRTTGEGYSCPIGDGSSDPCQRFDARPITGFRSGGTVGWAWMARQDGGHPYPYTRVATFRTSDLVKLEDTSIWNPEYAWVVPGAGVNSDGDVGVILYKMGGSTLPEARAFIVTDPATGWPPSRTYPVVASTTAPAALQWGHFSSVAPYGNCPQTFLGTAYAQVGGPGDAQVDNTMVWFGRPGTGCADLMVGSLSVTAASTGVSESARVGDRLEIRDTTRNTGSGRSESSRTAYFFSRDDVKDAGDHQLSPTHFVPELDGGASHTKTEEFATSRFPLGATYIEPGGDHWIFACADHKGVAAEITDTNNCRRTGPIQGLFGGPVPFDRTVTAVNWAQSGSVPTGGVLAARVGLRATGRGSDSALDDVGVRYTLARTRTRAPDEVALVARPRAAAGTRTRGASRSLALSLRIPARVATGRYLVRACLVVRRGRELRSANDCRVSSRTVEVVRPRQRR